MTAKDLLEKMDIRDTLFFNGEWQNGGLSTIMESYYGERKKELEKDIEAFAEWCQEKGWKYSPMQMNWYNHYLEDRKTTAQLREMWEAAARDKASQDENKNDVSSENDEKLN